MNAGRVKTENMAERIYYQMYAGLWVSPTSIELDNPKEVIPGPKISLGPPLPIRGFKNWFTKAPRFVISASRRGASPEDIISYDGYWLMNEKAKSVFEQIDPGAFEFVACDMRTPDGAAGPAYWLCDVVRVLDAIDEKESGIKPIIEPSGRKIYHLTGTATYKFRELIVKDAHAFRLLYADSAIIVDDMLKKACEAVKIRRIDFTRMN